jgi:hypothetical protein
MKTRKSKLLTSLLTTVALVFFGHVAFAPPPPTPATLSIQKVPGGVTLTVSGAPWSVHIVEQKTDLASTNWVPADFVLLNENGTATSNPITTTNKSMFYRSYAP